MGIFKNCSLCKEDKPATCFNKNKCKKDGLQTHCKDCNKIRSNKYYELNKESHKEKTKNDSKIIRIRNSQYIWDYLSNHPCVDCNESDPIVLEFDHVRGEKRMAVSELAHAREASLLSLQEEIAKCEVRCANCHRRKTAKQMNWYKDINNGTVA